jgi:hypothetical protein
MTAAVLSHPGTLVHARGREWVVLPDSSEDLLMVRPVGGLDEIKPVISSSWFGPWADWTRRSLA